MAKVILITGASTGIGAKFAELACSRGARVSLVARRKEALEEVVARCGGAAKALAVVADVTKRADVERAIQETLTHFDGKLDVLVNNVGRGISRPPSEITDEDIDEMMTINVKSALYGMQAVLPHFKSAKSGQIINISSVLGRHPSVLPRSAYSASKHFLNAMTAGMREELIADGFGDAIVVSLVSPGLVYTDFGTNALHGGIDSRKIPNGQDADEVAAVIMQAVETRVKDVYTKPGHKAQVMGYLDALTTDPAPLE